MRLTARENAAATGGFYFTFCEAENFTTAERLFHILHMQNISLIFELLRRFFFFIRKREGLEGRAVEKALLRKCFFQ